MRSSGAGAVALLTGGRATEPFVMLRALGDLEFRDIDLGAADTAGGAVVAVGSGWAERAHAEGVDVADVVIPRLRRAFDRVIGLDQETAAAVGFRPDVLHALDTVIKPNAIYRDPSLYGRLVGAHTPDGVWTERTAPVRPCAPAPDDLSKLHLGAPSFITETRPVRALRRRLLAPLPRLAHALADHAFAAAIRPLRAARPPRYTVHFRGSFTHVQRADALRRIVAARLSFRGGITPGPGPRALTPERTRALMTALRAEGLVVDRLPHWRYRLGMRECKAVLSLAGHGELCYRMGEAWAARRVLVCQDLSHLRTRFPLEAGRNVVYCRPDLGDLVAILDDIEVNFARYVDIAEQGHADWRAWSAQSIGVLRAGFAPLYGAAEA